MDEIVALITCKRCCRENVVPHKDNPHLCDECVKAEDSRVSYYRQHNYNWMDVAKEADLEVWERQPAETDREWLVWLTYRDTYPAARPSYSKVATQLSTTINVVKKVGQRWNFPLRMQAWAKYVDTLTMNQRTQEIVDMNKQHIDMASRLRDKISVAIDKINPETLAPNEIQGLFKLATEIERKARLDDPQLIKPSVGDDQNPELKKAPTKTEDMSTIIEILAKAGVLPTGGQNVVGIKQTTEILVKEE